MKIKLIFNLQDLHKLHELLKEASIFELTVNIKHSMLELKRSEPKSLSPSRRIFAPQPLNKKGNSIRSGSHSFPPWQASDATDANGATRPN